MTKEALKGESRDINFSFKLSRNNEISKIKITQSSGFKELDTQIRSILMATKISSDKKWWQFYNVTHQDHIHFDINKCP